MGSRYEALAMEYLEAKGYQIVEKNYRTTYGEIDVVLKKDTLLIFGEIKYRSSSRYGDPLAAVDRRKQKKISRVALHYCVTHGYSQEVSCRFDVIGIYGNGSIRHIENAFGFQ